MDFFEAQTQARGRTVRLLALFALALAGTVAAIYVAALFLGDIALTRPDGRWWRPELLAGTGLFTAVVCGGAALARWLALRAGGRCVRGQLLVVVGGGHERLQCTQGDGLVPSVRRGG